MAIQDSPDITEITARLHEIAYRDSATMVSVKAEDLRQLLDSTSKACVQGASTNRKEALADHFKTVARNPMGSYELGVQHPTWATSQANLDSNEAHHVEVLGHALAACIEEAGIIQPDVSLTGPQLLHFASDLRNVIISQRQAEEAYNALITFVLSSQTECAIEFLRCWNEGDFESCRQEWPEAPDAVYVGADSLHSKTMV